MPSLGQYILLLPMHVLVATEAERLASSSQPLTTFAHLPHHSISHLPAPLPLQFCYRLTREAGVTLIPVSAFYADRSEAPRTLVRFVFCKTDAKLQAACDALRAYFGKRS